MDTEKLKKELFEKKGTEKREGNINKVIDKLKSDPNRKGGIVCFWESSTACFKCCEIDEDGGLVNCWYEFCDV